MHAIMNSAKNVQVTMNIMMHDNNEHTWAS
jgi:hypothetical protein